MKLLFACLFVGTVYAAPGTHYCQQKCIKTADRSYFSIQCNCNNKGAAVGSCSCGGGATASGEPTSQYGGRYGNPEDVNLPLRSIQNKR